MLDKLLGTLFIVVFAAALAIGGQTKNTDTSGAASELVQTK